MPYIAPIKLSLFRKFLEAEGLHFRRIKGDHEIWGKAGLARVVVFPIKDKELSLFFIKSNLITLNISPEEFIAKIQALK